MQNDDTGMQQRERLLSEDLLLAFSILFGLSIPTETELTIEQILRLLEENPNGIQIIRRVLDRKISLHRYSEQDKEFFDQIYQIHGGADISFLMSLVTEFLLKKQLPCKHVWQNAGTTTANVVLQICEVCETAREAPDSNKYALASPNGPLTMQELKRIIAEENAGN